MLFARTAESASGQPQAWHKLTLLRVDAFFAHLVPGIIITICKLPKAVIPISP